MLLYSHVLGCSLNWEALLGNKTPLDSMSCRHVERDLKEKEQLNESLTSIVQITEI